MNNTELERAVKRILVADLEVASSSVERLEPTTPLLGRGLGLDSMEALTLATSLEQYFQIQISDAELTPGLFGSFSSLLELVRGKLAGSADCAPGEPLT